MMTEDSLKYRLWNFRRSLKELISHKRDVFAVPCVVYVESGTFKGHGIVWKEHDEELADNLFVLVESGNTWAYPVEDCRREDDKTKWPTWIKDGDCERFGDLVHVVVRTSPPAVHGDGGHWLRAGEGCGAVQAGPAGGLLLKTVPDSRAVDSSDRGRNRQRVGGEGRGRGGSGPARLHELPGCPEGGRNDGHKCDAGNPDRGRSGTVGVLGVVQRLSLRIPTKRKCFG